MGSMVTENADSGNKNTGNMDRVHRIQEHSQYQELWKRIQQEEQDRIFCRHTMEHFLDVARLMYIYNLENGTNIPKDVIYATALLHDIGRYEQIRNGTPHDIAGAGIAQEIMKDCGFTADEIQTVRNAILGHRDSASMESKERLTEYLYRADKKSRNCFACPAQEACNWPEEKKNLWIDY